MQHTGPQVKWRPIVKGCLLFKPRIVTQACDVSEKTSLIVTLSQWSLAAFDVCEYKEYLRRSGQCCSYHENLMDESLQDLGDEGLDLGKDELDLGWNILEWFNQVFKQVSE